MSTLRWLAKKAARSGMAIATRPLRAWNGASAQVRVLTYHRFGAARRDAFCVGVADFEQQMAWIAERGLAVSLAEIEAFVAGRTAIRPGSVLVTVDDGCPSLCAGALPVLRRHAIPAVAFVPAGELLDGDGPRPGGAETSESRITWGQLEAAVAAGLTVGSHGFTHRSLGKMSRAEAVEQAERSREILERRTGQRVTSFAYPFGTRADFSTGTAEVLRAAGYQTAFTSQHGVVRTGSDPLELPRVKVEGGEPFWMFRLLLDGGLDGWRWVDRTMWRVQASGA
jgi:peptidoglycan/xylan/chitin deacetylase (PgdA/CDA1 family)